METTIEIRGLGFRIQGLGFGSSDLGGWCGVSSN